MPTHVQGSWPLRQLLRVHRKFAGEEQVARPGRREDSPPGSFREIVFGFGSGARGAVGGAGFVIGELFQKSLKGLPALLSFVRKGAFGFSPKGSIPKMGSFWGI